MNHAAIRKELYGFLRGELSPETKSIVEHHLATCPRCVRILRELEATLRELPARQASPSSGREEQYWLQYIDAVEDLVDLRRVVRPSSRLPLWDAVVSLVWPNRRLVFVGGGIAAAAGILLMFWRPWVTEPLPSLRTAERSLPAETDRVGQYLRRSKALLVGLENMPPAEGPLLDLSSERDLSLELVQEARRLREEPLDPASARAVNDLEKILIALANLDHSADPATLELIRSGMRQRNTLFKVRMAERLRDSVMTLQTRYSF